MPRLSIKHFHLTLLDDVTGVHHRHAISMLSHSSQVVGDEQHRGAALIRKIFKQLHDLSPDRRVERCSGFIGDQ